jgi:hypothetical protein
MRKKLFSVIVFCIAGFAATAQEFDCKVDVKHDKILGVDAAVFTSMQRGLTEFMNTHKWTNDDFANNEKIEVNILFNLTGRVAGDVDGFSGTMNITSVRPVYNTSYTSPLINYIDKDVTFSFSQFVPLQFDDNHITGTNTLSSNLTAILAYYSYLILGLDYDSFSPLGGTQYFKKAQNIVNNAPEGSGITGWKVLDGNKNRYWLIDQILNTRFEEIRKYWYTMHREGLDNMYTKPDDSRRKIVAGIFKLSTVNRENPNSIYLQFFFNAKSDELMKIISQIPSRSERGPVLGLLSQMDVANTQKYNSLK